MTVVAVVAVVVVVMVVAVTVVIVTGAVVAGAAVTAGAPPQPPHSCGQLVWMLAMFPDVHMSAVKNSQPSLFWHGLHVSHAAGQRMLGSGSVSKLGGTLARIIASSSQ